MHEWQAHDGKILTSIMTVHQQKLIYVTGGNDDCIAEWDVGRVKTERERSKPTDNGTSPGHYLTFMTNFFLQSGSCIHSLSW